MQLSKSALRQLIAAAEAHHLAQLRTVEQPAETEEQAAIRAALTNIVAACCKIPMARPTDAGLECPHCEARAGESCKPGCWWPTIEAAIDDGREALRLAKETDNAD